MSSSPQVPSALTELITLVMKIGRKCPEAQGDILELMLLVSQIQAHVGIDHGYRHAKRVIARLRNPLWDDLTPDEREVLNHAAGAIKRACRLSEADIPDGGKEEPAPRLTATRDMVQGGLQAALGEELSPAQIARIATTVMVTLNEAQ
ncbi:MAG: hypothetical protein AVDCRST_MAG90-26 [uncultured Microvirga sp.]|uniref:Uncharacterized protein n=1 Tax=uncultured Microvirga sp. TaxID=412392 RepID=A0A6J4KGY8_9HYPH|nr:MAG: hypothetical protein AVDCRST_MAG90-26 [uncultured Microvirga sp.]